MNTEIMQRLARHMGISLAESFELEATHPKLFEFFQNEIESAQEDVNEQKLTETYDSGFDDEYWEGKTEGESQGWDDGYSEGLVEGREQGRLEAESE